MMERSQAQSSILNPMRMLRSFSTLPPSELPIRRADVSSGNSRPPRTRTSPVRPLRIVKWYRLFSVSTVMAACSGRESVSRPVTQSGGTSASMNVHTFT